MMTVIFAKRRPTKSFFLPKALETKLAPETVMARHRNVTTMLTTHVALVNFFSRTITFGNLTIKV